MAVFISYSRKDYYFAESLTFELLKRNVDAWLDVKDLKPGVDWERDIDRSLEAATCILLVASPDALGSPYVRAEWQRALKSGRRIVIALFRNVRLPPDLQNSEIVDCRGRFGPAVDRLEVRIRLDPAKPPPLPGVRSQISRIARVPPWVGIMALLLTTPTVTYIIASSWNSDELTGWSWVAVGGVVLLILALCARFLIAAWLRRKMGMTRLAICFASLSAINSFPLWVLLRQGAAGFAGFNSGYAEIIIAHPLRWAALSFLPLLGLVILVLFRPEDLLRWSPTGKAWRDYRVRRARDLPCSVPTVSDILSRIERFELLYDVPDEPAAARFRDVLLKMGARESTDSAGTTRVLLLTNRTRTTWLNRQSDRMGDGSLTVVGSPINLSQSVNWLWRREWIDFRAWKVQPARGFEHLPAVPESIDASHLPEPVNWMHHVLCAFATLLFSAGSVILPSSDVPGLSPWQTPVAYTAFTPALLFMYAAWALVRRSMTYRTFTRRICPAACLAALPGLACLYIYVTVLQQSPGRALAAGPFLTIAPILVYALQPRLAFWLPAPIPRSAEFPPESLDTGGHFRTLWVLLLYTGLWMLVLLRMD